MTWLFHKHVCSFLSTLIHQHDFETINYSARELVDYAFSLIFYKACKYTNYT